MRYVLDADVLVHLQRAGIASAVVALGPLPVVLTDLIWHEFVVAPQSAGASPRTVAEARTLAQTMVGQATVILSGSPEAAILAALLRPPVTEDSGELSVIAYAACHDDAIAVLFDRKALHRGVEELRGRVLSVHGFLEVLERHGLSRANSDLVSQRLRRQYAFREPHWW
jgi:hypothetical protein